VLVGPPGGLAALPAGARVATGSPRRSTQILAARPDLMVVPIRGNVGTRLDKLAAGAADALVLAAAGLRRLGLDPPDATPLPIDVSTPAPGQGLLAVQGPVADPAVAAAVTPLDDPVAHACLRAERALLGALGGGCMQPVGAFCEPRGGGLRMTAFAAPAEGAPGARVVREGALAEPEALGREAAAALAGVRG
jgi:hydroxymethylbilane synthase